MEVAGQFYMLENLTTSKMVTIGLVVIEEEGKKIAQGHHDLDL